MDGGEGSIRWRRGATDERGTGTRRRRIGRVGRREAEFAHEAGLKRRRDGAKEVVDVLEPRKGRTRYFCGTGKYVRRRLGHPVGRFLPKTLLIGVAESKSPILTTPVSVK